MNRLNVRFGLNLPPTWLEGNADGTLAPVNEELTGGSVRSDGDSDDKGII
jgi:hypothetical protein